MRKPPVGSPVGAWSREVAEGVLALVYPPLCVGCGQRLLDPNAPLCLLCVRRLERVEAADVKAQLASWPGTARLVQDGFALWMYDKAGTVRTLQHTLKYGNRPRLGLALGEWLGWAYAQHLDDHPQKPRPDRIVPVPLSRVRILERGYNQSAMLARGLASALHGGRAEDLLVRTRATRTQTALAQEDRRRNVQGAFAVSDPGRVAGRHLLVVDDVLTTGATLLAAAQPLQEAGAASIAVATFAFARHR